MVHEILKKLQERVVDADRRMNEQDRNGWEESVLYWAAYKNGVNAAIRDVEALAAEAGYGR